MKTLHRSVVVLFLALVSLDPRSTFCQGPLTPPGSPVPTMKTLDQLEARTIVNAANTPSDATNTFIISAAGSYYLTGNLTGAVGKHGISVQADDVTLDLNGFALISGGSGTTRGVDLPIAKNNLCVRNGTIRGWSDGGVRTDLGTGVLAEKLRLSNNLVSGLSVGNGLARDCTASGNTLGISMGSGTARDCVATGNITGFVLGNGAQVRDSTATGNTTGFIGSDRSMISGCLSTLNTGIGFSCTSYVTIADSTSSRNGSHGIVVGDRSEVVRCNSSRNVTLGAGAGGSGIITGLGCQVTDCTAGANALDGITADSASTVRGCTAQANVGTGVLVTSNCFVLANTCDLGSCGVYGNGNGNRIEGNSCNFNTGTLGTGVQINGTNNLIIRNSARGSRLFNYSFSLGNQWGTIIQATSSGTPGVAGDSAPSSFASENPWANFAY